jgi:type IV pilus assembly protein PilO
MVGTYHNTGLFFDRVSKLSRIINVVDFSMVRARDPSRSRETGEDPILVKTTCMMNTYRFVEKKVEEKKSEKKTTGKEEDDAKLRK